MADLTKNIVVVQRQSPNWHSLSDDSFLKQSKQFCILWGKEEDYIYRLYYLWNKTFSLGYLSVRTQLKALSELSINASEQVSFVPYQDYTNIPNVSGYYLFMDDDDWLDPVIAEKLFCHNIQQNSLLLWRSANIGSPNQQQGVFVWGMNGRCMTNNYAVSSEWLESLNKLNQVIQHKAATALFEEMNKINIIPHMDCALSVSNKTPISSVSLDRGLEGDLSSDKLVGLVANYLEKMKEIKQEDLVYIPWAKPYIEKTIMIFEEVYQSRR